MYVHFMHYHTTDGVRLHFSQSRSLALMALLCFLVCCTLQQTCIYAAVARILNINALQVLLFFVCVTYADATTRARRYNKHSAKVVIGYTLDTFFFIALNLFIVFFVP